MKDRINNFLHEFHAAIIKQIFKMKLKFNNIVKCTMLFACLYSITDCKNKETKAKEASLKSVVENCIGKKLILPDSLSAYKPFTNYIADGVEMANAAIKIYSHINASCPTCIRDIVLWNSIIPYFSKYKVPVILVCESKDNFELVKYFHESGEIKSFSYPLFFDLKNEYIKSNKFMKESQQFETVLTDKENNILLLGNPIRSKEMKELYIKEIQKRM